MNIKYIITSHGYRRHKTCEEAVKERDRIRNELAEYDPDRADALRVLTVIDEPNIRAMERDISGVKVWVSEHESQYGTDVELFNSEGDAYAHMTEMVAALWAVDKEELDNESEERGLAIESREDRTDAYFVIMNDAGEDSEFMRIYARTIR